MAGLLSERGDDEFFALNEQARLRRVRQRRSGSAHIRTSTLNFELSAGFIGSDLRPNRAMPWVIAGMLDRMRDSLVTSRL